MSEMPQLAEVATGGEEHGARIDFDPTIEDLAHSWYAANHLDGDTDRLIARYRGIRRAFEAAHGRIEQEWWSTEAPGGMVLTAKHIRLRRRPDTESWTLHRHTSKVTTNSPEAEQPLSAGDNLALRSNETLRGSPRRIALARVFGLASAFLEAIDAANRRVRAEDGTSISPADANRRIAEANRQYRRGLREAENYYHRTAVRSAQIDYFTGLWNGFLAVCFSIAVTVLIADVLLRWSGIPVPAETYANLIAATIAGSLGSCVSVMWRMSTGDFRSDYEAGREHLRMIGAFRPPIGAIFGLALYFAVQADLLSFANDEPDFYLLTFVAFVGGFSERFAPDVFGKVEGKEQNGSPPAATPAGDFASSVLPDEEELAGPDPVE
jgi:hypothetical protein